MQKPTIMAMLIGGLIFVGAQLANATLIVNGTFDSDLSGWDSSGSTTGVTWISGTAHVGRPGTPGEAVFSQAFDIDDDAHKLQVVFDYQWQVNEPTSVDTFMAELIYESTGGTITHLLLSESSDNGLFGTTVFFDGLVPVSNLDGIASPNASIKFTLTETNQQAGTRVQLDNVVVQSVPVVPTFWLLVAGILGISVCGVRTKNNSLSSA